MMAVLEGYVSNEWHKLLPLRLTGESVLSINLFLPVIFQLFSSYSPVNLHKKPCFTGQMWSLTGE
jgi:hypothetical protein